MGVSQDQALTRLSDAVTLAGLLKPRARLLVEQTHDLEYETIHSVKELRVQRVTLAERLQPLDHRRGFWSQVVPSATRSEFSWEGEARDPVWIDALAELEIELVAQTDPGGIDSLVVKAVDSYQTVEEFQAQFTYLDLKAFMASHGLSTVEDLKEAGNYLRTEVKLRRPPVFDPTDPVNTRTVRVSAALLLADRTDVKGALRAARLVGAAARDRPLPLGGPGIRTTPYALVSVFHPPSPPPPQALTDAQIETLLTGAGIAPLFLT